MDNRRADYRHTFRTQDDIQVELESALTHTKIRGRLRDLSTTGMKIWLLDPPVGVTRSESWILRAPVPGLARSSARATIVYYEPGSAGGHCGMRFLRLADPRATEAREKQIWRFLLDEQRRPIRHRYGDCKAAASGFLRIYAPTD